MPSGDADISLVEPMSACFRLSNKRQEKIKIHVEFLNHLYKNLVELLVKINHFQEIQFIFIFRHQIVQI